MSGNALFRTHLLQSGTDIRTVQDLMGHASVEPTMLYLHVMQRPGAGGPSPLDIARIPIFPKIPHFLLGKASAAG